MTVHVVWDSNSCESGCHVSFKKGKVIDGWPNHPSSYQITVTGGQPLIWG